MACQITLSEREQIAQFRIQGLPKAEMARQLGRHPCTIGRELVRNSDGVNYWASNAQHQARARRQRRPRKLDDPQLNQDVRSGLAKCWSPEQIAGRAARDFRHSRWRQQSHSAVSRGCDSFSPSHGADGTGDELACFHSPILVLEPEGPK